MPVPVEEVIGKSTDGLIVSWPSKALWLIDDVPVAATAAATVAVLNAVATTALATTATAFVATTADAPDRASGSVTIVGQLFTSRTRAMPCVCPWAQLLQPSRCPPGGGQS